MLVGFARDGRARKVIGIDASFTPAQTRAQVLEIARNTADLVELGREIVEQDIVLVGIMPTPPMAFRRRRRRRPSACAPASKA